jgi:hypothetical protein
MQARYPESVIANRTTTTLRRARPSVAGQRAA